MGRRLREEQHATRQAADLQLLLSGSAPRLDPRFRIGLVPPDLVFFLAGEASQVVRGERWAALVPAIDGRLGVGEIGDAAGLAAFEVEHALAVLAEQGLLGGAGEERLVGPPPSRTARVGGRPLAVVPLGGPEAPGLAAALAAAGVADPAAARDLVLVEDHLSPELARWDAGARASGRAWLPAAVVGDALWMGPLCGPGAPACWTCLAADLGRSLPVVALWHRLGGRLREPATSTWTDAAIAGRLAIELGDPDEPWRESLLAIELATGRAVAHAARRYPSCPRCGRQSAAGGSSAAVRLAPRPIVSSADGGWRGAEPAAVRERLVPFLSPLTGWIHDLRPRPLDVELGTHVAIASHPYPDPVQSFDDLGRRPRAAAAGKGMTALQAELGALAEAIERQCGVFRGDEPRRRATQDELGEVAIAPNAVQLFSDRQLAALDAGGDGRHTPTTAFDPQVPLDWTPLWSLTQQRRRLLPTTLCYHGYRGPGRAPADSNGCAAGAGREEAILQGLLELLERDQAAIWWHHRLRRPACSVSDRLTPTLDRAAAAHRRAGRELAVLDLTADLGIPVAAAISRPIGSGEIQLGFGAHLDPDLAAGRALAELHQFWPSGADGAHRPREARAVDGRRREAPGSEAGGARRRVGFRGARRGRGPSGREWLTPDPAASLAPASDPPSFRDLRDAIEHLVARLAERDIEVLVLDQTRDGSPLAVVRVVAPGLRPWWRRLAPGRLYEVPVALGWQAAVASEADLNPDPIPA